ncbi:sensor histidine kinase [Actinomarinicola tropica]|uniref:histidine kinase n=1 Tax=Actinomarinicola tropica TaxID=2789776 RepID=A0A5Q2RNA0_9ACTN|nr:HAMP domain-containing sensor histidine kinase [Actinomarinicola tropica]QGG95567.1 HAMP domain-containing protein [Actinomarinicola tropica]
MRLRPRPLGLRSRITLAFGLGSLILAVTLASSTWAFTRESQLNLREDEYLDTVIRNAERVRSSLTQGRPEEMREFLAQLSTSAASPIIRESISRGGEIPTTSQPPGAFDTVPRSVRQAVEGDGKASLMHYRLADTPVLVLGIPIPSVDAAYYEIFELDELERTLDLLAAYLTGATILVTLAGATLGWWASRRTLLPLTDVGLAAHAIAGGRLDTRLEVANDPDLTVLVSSFNEMAATLQARIERDARFASDVSHELRSPLMTLAASLEVLQTRRDDMPERAQSALDLLVDDVNRFQQLVSDLLEISRFDAGAAHLQLEEVLLPEFLSRAVAAAAHEPIPVVTDATSADLVVEVDKRRMAQVIANLLDNAHKYGDGATAVRVTRSADADEVVISVEDHGPGVDAEDRDRIFERFSRAVSTAGTRGSDTGSGLGLALVAEHVALHGGRVGVEDRLDGEPGARFTVTLPIQAAPSEDDLSRVLPVEVGSPHLLAEEHPAEIER